MEAQRHLSHLRFGAEPVPAPIQPLSPEEREELLGREREQLVCDELHYSRHQRTLANYQRANERFNAFLQEMYDDVSHGWLTCRPDHVCLFLRRSLLPSLIGRTAGACVAISTLQSWVSALGRCFELRGRGVTWCDQAGVGNPVHSGLVRSALHVYQQQQTLAGRRVRSAVPMLEPKLTLLVAGMDRALEAALRGHHAQRAELLLRDVTFMLYLWNSGRRGQDALYANWSDLYLQLADRSLLSVARAWWAEVEQAAPVPAVLLMVPLRSKTEQSRRPQTQEIRANDSSALCAIRRLRTLYQWQRAQLGSEPRGPVFLAQRAPPVRLTAHAAGSRVRHNVVTYGEDGGETMHSFRRGHVQAAQAADEPVSVTMQRTGMACVSTFRRYADRGRHLR